MSFLNSTVSWNIYFQDKSSFVASRIVEKEHLLPVNGSIYQCNCFSKPL